ncbi:MAG: DUF4271 domain-containing protein [Reichenbachiella sp.]|uniref:DUF4271 domain-containing protein n=1 Tax=Reichenbachiella sp. TaxID=2184521 RepID=UPI003298C210
MLRWITLFICLFSYFIYHDSHASDTELKNLRWEWEVYDDDAGHFVPYFKQQKTQTVRFNVDLSKYRDSYLKLDLPPNYFVWIDGKLVFSNLTEGTRFWKLDSLNKIYKKGQVQMTLYGSEVISQAVGTSVVNIQSEDLTEDVNKFFLQRNDHGQLDNFIIISIATLSLIALFRAFNFRLFREYFSVGKSLQLRQNFDLITAHAPLSWPNMAFMLFYAVLVGNTAMNVDLFLTRPIFDASFDLSATSNLSLGFHVFAICLVLMIGKLILITIGTELFKINKVRAVHFFTYFRQSLIMAMIMFSLSVINGILGGMLVDEYWNLIQLILVLAWSGRLVLIFFVLNKIYTFRKLHLFSYLCSSEMIPLLLLFKIFLK